MRGWVVCILVVLLVGGACVRVSTGLQHDLDSRKDQVSAVDKQIVPAKVDIPRVTRLRNALKNQREAMVLYGDFPKLIGADAAAVAHILAAVDKSRPAAVTVTRMSLKPGGQPLGLGFIAEAQPGHVAPPLPVLELSATAPNPRDLETFQESLSQLACCDRLQAKRMQEGAVQVEMWCKTSPPP